MGRLEPGRREAGSVGADPVVEPDAEVIEDPDTGHDAAPAIVP